LGKSKLGSKIEGISQQLGGFGAVFSQVAVGFAVFQGFAQAGKFVYDFAKEFENASKVVQAASGEMGESVQTNTAAVIATSETFGVSVEDISAAAKKLASTGAVDFAGALELINAGLLSGQADAAGYVKGIEDSAGAVDKFGKASMEAVQEQRALLEANQELATAQGELSAEFKGAGAAVNTVWVSIKTGLVVALVALINFVKPVLKSFFEFGSALFRLAERFGVISILTKTFTGLVYALSIPFRIAFEYTKTFYGAITGLINGFLNFIDTVPILKSGVDKIVGFFVGLVDVVTSIPRYFAEMVSGITGALTGMVSAVGSAVYSTVDTISFGLLDKTVQEYKAFNAEIAAEQEKAAANDRARAQLEAENIRKRSEDRKKAFDQLKKDFDSDFIEKLTDEQKKAFEGVFTFTKTAAEIQGKDAGTAYSEAYAAGLKALGKLGVDVTTKEQEKINKEAAEKAKADAQRAAEERKRLREEAFKAQLEFEKQNASILLQQQRELSDLVIQAIEDEQARQIASIREQSKREIEDRKAQLLEREAATAEFLKKQAAAFGKGSEEYRKQQALANAQIVQDRKDTGAIIVAVEKQTETEIAKVKADGSKKELERIKADAEKQLQLLESANKFELEAQKVQNEGLLLNLQQGGAKELDLLKAQNAARKEEILAQLAAIEEAEKEAASLGLERTTEQSQNTFLERKRLLNALLKLDIDQAQKEKDTAEKAAKEQKEIRAKQFDTIASYAQQSLNTIGDFIDALDAAEAQRLEQRAETQNKLISDLETRAQNATGLQRVALEQQVEQEKKAGEKIAAEREKLETERKKRAKATAIAESIINTAVAVTKVIANPFLAVVVGALGALQTAAILAQPLATGGLVGYPETPKEGGVIMNAPNSKRSRLGDEVLIHAKRGEVVMNAIQIQKAGGYRALNKNFGVPLPKNIPAFATGGVVGTISPNVANLETYRKVQGAGSGGAITANQMQQFAEMIAQVSVQNTQDMIDAQQEKTTVAVSVASVEAVQNQSAAIKKAAIF
jgi:hypothetical protein